MYFRIPELFPNSRPRGNPASLIIWYSWLIRKSAAYICFLYLLLTLFIYAHMLPVYSNILISTCLHTHTHIHTQKHTLLYVTAQAQNIANRGNWKVLASISLATFSIKMVEKLNLQYPLLFINIYKSIK